MAFMIDSTLASGISNQSYWTNGDLKPTLSVAASFNITDLDLDYLYHITGMTTKQTFNTTSSNENRSDLFRYCSEDFKKFREWFTDTHGILCAIVCIFGLITNILNIIVLTRKDMVSPINAILTGLAVTDMMVMVDYLPFTIYTYILGKKLDDCIKYSYSLSLCTLIHAHFSVICHNVSIGLTLTLAVWRFIAVNFPQNNRQWCSMNRAILAIVICYVFIPILTIPVFLSFQMKEIEISCKPVSSPTVMTSSTSSALSLSAASLDGGSFDTVHDGSYFSDLTSPRCLENCTVYEIGFSEISLANNQLLQKVNFWIYSVLVKLLPCLALTVLSLSLIQALYRTNRKRQQLKNRKCCNVDRSCDRTTRMLLAILLLFLITEFPQGILALLSGVLGEKFYNDCTLSFSEIVDLLALINSAINFILYCVMSKQFRQTFRQLFTPTIINNWMAIQHDVTTTQATTCV